MAHHSLSKIAQFPQSLTQSSDHKLENPEGSDFSGVARYLSDISENGRGRYHLLKRTKIRDAERRMMAALREMVAEEAERILSIWVSSHPDRDSWISEPEPAKGNFHTPQQREVIRKAYARYGCDVCGLKKDPHFADGLCQRCYGRRASRRRYASMELADSKPQRPGGRAKPRQDAQG